MSIRAVVFDLDDTLYPERQFAFSGFDAVAATYETTLGPRDRSSQRMRELFDTDHRRRVFDRLLAELGLTSSTQLVQAMVSTYRNHTPRITLFSDADTTLTRLRGRYKLGLITDGPAVMQWSKIETLGLRNRVDAIIATDDLGPEFAKPHSRAFEAMAARLNVAHAECVYVADNPQKDFLAPRGLGWLTIQLNRSGGIYQDCEPPLNGAPDRSIISLDELDHQLESPS